MKCWCVLFTLLVGLGPFAAGEEFPSAGAVKPDHPRLLMLDADLDALKADYAAGGQPTLHWVDALKIEAEAVLKQPVLQYPGPDDDILDQSRTLMRRAYLLGFMYRWSEDGRYAERLWRDLEAAAGQPSWRPHVQFLTTAEMLHGVAVAYDWLHDYWTEDRRKVLREAIIRKGLEAGKAAYAGELPGYAGWNSRHNWNVVCNGGLLLGVAAILPHEKALCEEIARGAMERLPRVIQQFGKDGGWAEGPTYWGYTMSYLGTTLAALETAFGSDFGLSEIHSGLAHTGDFAVQMTSPTGLPFNFADSEMGRPRSHALFELARRFNRPDFARYQVLYGEGNARDLAAWSRALHLRTEWDALPDPPLEKYFSGVGVWVARSSWHDQGASFLALKAGSNGANHGHLDLGSFVLDALGHRWVHDLDKESYGSPGFFETSEAGRRWLYYGIRAEGHNTLVINPSGKPDQYVRAKARTLAREANACEAYYVVDLTDAYLPGAKRVWRGVRLTDSRSRIHLLDEVDLVKPGMIVWTIHVRDPITLSEDRREATLSAAHRRLVIRLDEPSDAVFEILPAEPLVPITQVPQRPNPDFQKLVVRLPDRDSARIAVWFAPMPTAIDPPFRRDLKFGPLSEWELESPELALLETASVDGVPLADFRPEQFTLHAESVGPGVLTVCPENAIAESVVAKTGENETTHYLRTRSEERAPTLYQVRVSQVLPPPPVLAKLPDRSHLKASGSSDAENPPRNVLDGSLATRWSAEDGHAQLLIDLGEHHPSLAALAVAFFKGDARRTAISAEVSTDGEIFHQILPQTWSSGRSLEAEIFPLAEPVRARFIRITGHGNDENGWTSITEVAPLTTPEADPS